ncbi:MAG: hypothetical protein ISS70_01515 [Phycisphaerae bacterium]|nr:hypothetical protein [Phycisphaerae bacterium]
MDIRKLAADMTAAVQQFFTKAKRFYYLVMLLGRRCPKCNGPLTMTVAGRCTCRSCRYEFDPTVVFQRCLHCGGTAVLRVRRYQCSDCGNDITSMFLFEGVAFDTDYFRKKMSESRQRKKEQKQRVQQMLSECRSEPLSLDVADLSSVPGLIGALNSLTKDLEASIPPELRNQFDLSRYQQHITSHVGAQPKDLRAIPPLTENLRLDLIWKFIAAIFLDHAGLVSVNQQDQTIWVMRYDDREGQDIPGNPEEADGFEGPAGRAQAW